DKSIAIKGAQGLISKQDSTISVTGKIVDVKTSVGLPGVSIYIKGSSNGTISDVDGNYRVIVPSGKSILIFSFLGYEQQEIIVGQQKIINISLADVAALLKDVVVIGYGESSRKQLASAVSSVSPEDLNRGAITDVAQLLQGKVAGLNITADGNPNRPSAVILRGASTLNSSQSPFYVIDGIPGADISIIAPDDIASVDVLKDAAATAIYGNRAANGVIMVTTKRGKSGQMQVSLNSYVGIEKVSNQLKMMDTNQLRSFVKNNNQSFSPADDLGANTNWQSAIERTTAVSQSHNLLFSGGTENNNYSASLSYMNKEGIILKSNLSRVIARLSLEQYFLDHKIKFGLTVANSNNVANNTPQLNTALLQAVKHLPVSPVKNADGTYFENFNNSNYFNPVAMINHGKDDTKYNSLVAGFNTHVLLPFGFIYDLNISYLNSTSMHGEFYDSYYSQYTSAHFYNNPDPPATHVLVDFGTNGSALRNTYQNSSKIMETYLTWNRTLGDHSFNAVLGYSWQNNIYGDGFQATTTNFPIDNIGYNNLALSNYRAINGYTVNFGPDGIYQETRLISDFARLNYSYKEKYMMQASVRRDGSSVFGANNKWGYFPSLGVAWRIGQEGFMHNQNIFDDLKLRASYGVTGNTTGFNAYSAQFISGSLGTYYYNGVQTAAYGPIQAANPNLKWEKTTTTNLGLDFVILKNSVSGSVEWYNKKTDGMIWSYSVDPMVVPQGSIVANGGSMSNKGIEISLEATPVKNNSFSWTTNLNLAHNINKIVSLTNPLFIGGDSIGKTQPDGGGQTGSTLQILKSGKPLGQFFTLQYAGKDTGMVSQYVDHHGNLTRSPLIGTDYHYAGSPQPKLLMGWTNTFRYKNFDLNIFIRGVFGNKIFNATRADLFRPSTATSANILVDAAGESTKDFNAYKYSTRFIEDGSYLRLDNATLGYNFKNISRYVKAFRIYVSVNNLFVITKYTGVDPEVNQGGIAPGVDSNNYYPKTRTILFGANVSF
ncbi:MAG TPA: SusC/RagA family TonB-linked outer membrane protein, partial [Bacteroidales bacterium]